ncbi:MAG: hypothetical protein M3O35_19040 [Acidobacteriota bacterium]|nr:hypothetical protein [Acidobacteriota bacterium]
MKTNLDALRKEIREHLEQTGFTVFHGYSRLSESLPAVLWDSDVYPDYKLFLKTAEAAGVKLVVFHEREFHGGQVEEALEEIEISDIPRDEARALERRLNELRAYEGFTCALELSFDHEGRMYLFDLRTEWYSEFTDLVDELNMLSPQAEEEHDEGPMGGYFSKN